MKKKLMIIGFFLATLLMIVTPNINALNQNIVKQENNLSTQGKHGPFPCGLWAFANKRLKKLDGRTPITFVGGLILLTQQLFNFWIISMVLLIGLQVGVDVFYDCNICSN